MHTISFQINENTNSKLETLAKVQERSKGYLLRKAVESYLQDQEDLRLAATALEEFEASGRQTFSLEQIKEENGL